MGVIGKAALEAGMKWWASPQLTFRFDAVASHCSELLDQYLQYSRNIDAMAAHFKPTNKRNEIYADGIDGLEPDKSAVVCVGSNHVYFDYGILKRLKDKGWNISRVPCEPWSTNPEETRAISSRIFRELHSLAVSAERNSRAKNTSARNVSRQSLRKRQQRIRPFGTGTPELKCPCIIL